MLLVVLLWTVALPSLATVQVGGSVSDGWSSVAVTQNTSSLLERALQNESSYREGVTARVCVLEIRSLSQQVVSGMNYRYDVQACPVSSVKSAGMCAVKTLTTNSSCNEYEIQLYEQSWTNTLQVTSIALLSNGTVGGDADANATAGSTSNDTSNASTSSTAPSSAASKVPSSSSSSNTVVAPSPTSLPTATKSSAVAAFSSSSVVVALVSVCLVALGVA